MTTSSQLRREFDDQIGYLQNKFDHPGIINGGYTALLNGLAGYAGAQGNAAVLVTQARDDYASSNPGKAQEIDWVQQAKAQVTF